MFFTFRGILKKKCRNDIPENGHRCAGIPAGTDPEYNFWKLTKVG
jgi:hypothetical protein